MEGEKRIKLCVSLLEFARSRKNAPLFRYIKYGITALEGFSEMIRIPLFHPLKLCNIIFFQVRVGIFSHCFGAQKRGKKKGNNWKKCSPFAIEVDTFPKLFPWRLLLCRSIAAGGWSEWGLFTTSDRENFFMFSLGAIEKLFSSVVKWT